MNQKTSSVRRVVTYALCYQAHHEVSLCARHAETHRGLGEVRHGAHRGTCFDCETGKLVTVTLHSANMGDVSEADYDAWVAYVDKHIDEHTGLFVTVTAARFGVNLGTDQCSNEEHADVIREALRVLWKEFCADNSAWPRAEEQQ